MRRKHAPFPVKDLKWLEDGVYIYQNGCFDYVDKKHSTGGFYFPVLGKYPGVLVKRRHELYKIGLNRVEESNAEWRAVDNMPTHNATCLVSDYFDFVNKAIKYLKGDVFIPKQFYWVFVPNAGHKHTGISDFYSGAGVRPDHEKHYWRDIRNVSYLLNY